MKGEYGNGEKTVGLKGKYKYEAVTYEWCGSGCRNPRTVVINEDYESEGPKTVVVSRSGSCCDYDPNADGSSSED